jgi:hypothetical protein
MVQFYSDIPDFLIPWIRAQKMFWVATAPLSPTGHINVSPKGYEGTFNIVDRRTVWYEDLSGSGECFELLSMKAQGGLTYVGQA